MADSSTPRYNLTKPEVDGSDDTWGQKLNVNFDVIDASMGYATWSNISGKPSTFPPTLPIATSDVTGLDTKQAAQDSALATEVTNRTNADAALQSAGTALTGRVDAVEAKNTSQDAAIALRLTDAPNDGKQYARKSAAWNEVVIPPSGIPEAPTDGLVYGRKNAAWATVIGGATTDDLPPPAPLQDGQLWWKSTTGVLYLWYVEPGDPVTAGQWVQCSASPQIIDNNYTRKTARARNRINNPTAQVSQENGTAVVSTSGAYAADQWSLNFSGIVAAGQRVTLATPTPEGTVTGVSVYATAAKASLVTTDNLTLVLPIEGKDVADFDWGSAQAKPVVLRFCAICDIPGTYGVSIGNAAPATRCWVGSFTIAQAGVPQVFAIPVIGDVTGTWDIGFILGISIRFGYAVGPSFVGVAGWQAGNFFGPVGLTNGAAVANAKLAITDVGLHLDPDNTGLAPPFNAPPYEDDLARCMRYYERTMRHFLQDYTIAGNGVSFSYSWSVPKRVAPTSAFIFNNNTSAGVPTVNGLSDKGFIIGTIKDGVTGTFNITFELAVYARMI